MNCIIVIDVQCDSWQNNLRDSLQNKVKISIDKAFFFLFCSINWQQSKKLIQCFFFIVLIITDMYLIDVCPFACFCLFVCLFGVFFSTYTYFDRLKTSYLELPFSIFNHKIRICVTELTPHCAFKRLWISNYRWITLLTLILQNVKSRIVRRVLVRVSARDAGSPSCPIGDSV